MKIAATYENGNIFQHFGRTQSFKIYEVQNNAVISAEVIGVGGAGHEALAGVLADQNVDVLICGGMGMGAQMALADESIEVISGASGDADEAVRAYLAGELVSAGVNCDHHGEGHSCGHHNSGPDKAADNAEETAGSEEGQTAAGTAEYSEEAEGCGCGGGCAEDGEGCGGCGGGCGGCGGGCRPVIEGVNVGKTCRVHYRGTFNDGTQFDSSYDRGEPLEFICGAGMMIPGFDQAVANMKQGQILDVHLMPEEAYGPTDPSQILTIEIEKLPGSEDLKVGQQVYLSNGMRQFPVRVTAKNDETITLDANHEMAGKELNFRIELVELS